MVHRALELFYAPSDLPRSTERMHACVNEMLVEYRNEHDVKYLQLDDSAYDELGSECNQLASAVFEMEDPESIEPIGLELNVQAEIGSVTLRGIIDRLERNAAGKLVITDYKTGRAPGPAFEKKALGGLNLYSLMCHRTFGEIADEIRLMYVKSGQTITARPNEQSLKFAENRVTAVHQAVARACETNDFVAKKSALCKFCAFQKWCPVFGGDPERALTEAPTRPSTGQ